MFRVVLYAAALLFAGQACAADQPIYAPEPAWVKALPIPTAPAANDGSPVQVLLVDRQSDLAADGDQYYSRNVIKILSPQGLGPSGQIAQNWDPATETLTIHYLHVIHDGKVTDVLADGNKFLVLRRENNLELAVLDGRMTATIQPEGLEVGDIIDMAFTVTRQDPALGGHSVDFNMLSHQGVAGRVYFRTIWGPAEPVSWRQTIGIDAPTVTRTADGAEAVVDIANAVAPKPPANAPSRFQQVGTLEFSDLHDWSKLSGLLAPLYEKAEILKPASPLQDEIAKIAAASPDPKTRATAALRLVEDRTRYVFLGMNDAGLVPAAADQTWSRRFGDCKGKSVLLVAVLRALGLDATPVAVSTQAGDGMDQRLPNIGWFDHVIVRLRIGPKTYWLDGTRQGDLGLDDLVIPNDHWVLPIRPGGEGLTPLDPPPLDTPMFETLIKIDASKGIAPPAPTHIELIYRGEAAVSERQSLMSSPRADFDRNLREVLAKGYPWFTADTVDVVQDDAGNQVRLIGDGSAKVDWGTAPDGSRFYHALHSSMANDTGFKREPGPNSDAPFAVPYPGFVKSVQEITLPVDGDFALVGPDVDAKIAGEELKRTSRIADGVLRVEISVRSLVPEFPAAQAEAAGAALRALPPGEVIATYHVRGGQAQPLSPASTDLDADRQAAEHGDAGAQYRLAASYSGGKGVPFDMVQAVVWLRKSADQGDVQAQNDLGVLYARGQGVPQDIAQAVSWWRQAAAKGAVDAQGNLAAVYLGGHGDPQDYATVNHWCRQAADRGQTVGQTCLGFIYANGAGVTRDANQAVQWWLKAAGQGDQGAENALGSAYEFGRGVPVDYAKATLWFGKTADAGNPWGMYNLAALSLSGRGGRLDYAKAYMWLDLAAQRFPASAAHLRDMTVQWRSIAATHLSGPQREQIKTLTAAWLAQHPAPAPARAP
jgi:TPR repeat protein